MKRSKPLRRTGGLKRGGPLKRTRMTTKHKRNKVLEQGSAEARQRAEGLCEARWSGCQRTGHHAHHIRRRSQGGADTADNLLIVCFACHEAIHRNPEYAAERGHLKFGG